MWLAVMLVCTFFNAVLFALVLWLASVVAGERRKMDEEMKAVREAMCLLCAWAEDERKKKEEARKWQETMLRV